MFTILREPTFTHIVPVQVPIDGGHRRETMKVTYRVLDPEVVDGYDLGDRKSSTAFLSEVVIRVEDLADEAGQPVPWSDEVRERLLKLPYVRLALARGYFDAVAKGAAGN